MTKRQQDITGALVVFVCCAIILLLGGCITPAAAQSSYGGGTYYVQPQAQYRDVYGAPCQPSLPECRAGVQGLPGPWNIQQVTPRNGCPTTLVVTPRPIGYYYGGTVYAPSYGYSAYQPYYSSGVSVGIHIGGGHHGYRRH